jgi:hypothetical protein
MLPTILTLRSDSSGVLPLSSSVPLLPLTPLSTGFLLLCCSSTGGTITSAPLSWCCTLSSRTFSSLALSSTTPPTGNRPLPLSSLLSLSPCPTSAPSAADSLAPCRWSPLSSLDTTSTSASQLLPSVPLPLSSSVFLTTLSGHPRNDGRRCQLRECSSVSSSCLCYRQEQRASQLGFHGQVCPLSPSLLFSPFSISLSIPITHRWCLSAFAEGSALFAMVVRYIGGNIGTFPLSPSLYLTALPPVALALQRRATCSKESG